MSRSVVVIGMRGTTHCYVRQVRHNIEHLHALVAVPQPLAETVEIGWPKQKLSYIILGNVRRKSVSGT